jgi:hypothetical protein
MKWPFMDAKVNRVRDVATSFELLITVKPTACCIGARAVKQDTNHWSAQTSHHCQLIARQRLVITILHHKY